MGSPKGGKPLVLRTKTQMLAAMLRYLVIAALALTVPASAAAQPSPSYRLIDLSDDFVDFYDRNESLSAEARAQAFRREVAPLWPQFYNPRRNDQSDADYNALIASHLAAFPELRARYELKAAGFAALLDPAIASFRQTFPDLPRLGDIYLVHSMGEMDGGTRQFGLARPALVFGIDVMARTHPYEDEQPFFHHELFHVYHFQSFRTCGSVWCSLWAEGLATYAAKTLNPNASDAQLLLSVPEPIRDAVDANLEEAVCTVKARLNSRGADDMRALFSFRRFNERLPPRFGYYVGFLVAQEAARTHSLQDLARMDNRMAAPVLDAALASLATCPTN